jgi:hypothetical protein
MNFERSSFDFNPCFLIAIIAMQWLMILLCGQCWGSGASKGNVYEGDWVSGVSFLTNCFDFLFFGGVCQCADCGLLFFFVGARCPMAMELTFGKMEAVTMASSSMASAAVKESCVGSHEILLATCTLVRNVPTRCNTFLPNCHLSLYTI